MRLDYKTFLDPRETILDWLDIIFQIIIIFFILLVTESCRLCIVDLEFNYVIEFRFLFLLQSMDGEILNFSVTMKYTPFSNIQKNWQLCFISDGKKYRWYINVIRNEIHMLKKWCYWHKQIYHCRQSVSTKWKFNCKKKNNPV